MPILRFGVSSTVSLDSAEGTAPVVRGQPQEKPIEDVVAAVRQSLKEPLGYPPIEKCVVPDDRVVLALDCGLPHPAEISTGVIQSLLEAGVAAGNISILQAHEDAVAGDPRRLLPPDVAAVVNLLEHNPSEPMAAAYLGANAADEAIRVHRALQEADVVLPIGCLRPESSLGYFGIHGVVYPNFSDDKTQKRFRTPVMLEDGGRMRQRLLADVDAAAWALGVTLAMQVVPSDGGGVVRVLSGETEAVRQEGRRSYAKTWSDADCPKAPLVVAAIAGGLEQQTWENLGRALAAAGELVEENGAVVVCCDLAATPGPAIQHMSSARSREWAMRQIAKHPAIDSLCAAQLDLVQRSSRVYLVSGLPVALCEQLDITPVAPEELARLTQRTASVILLANAQWAMVKPIEE